MTRDPVMKVYFIINFFVCIVKINFINYVLIYCLYIQMDSVSLKLRIQIWYPCKNLIALEIIQIYHCQNLYWWTNILCFLSVIINKFEYHCDWCLRGLQVDISEEGHHRISKTSYVVYGTRKIGEYGCNVLHYKNWEWDDSTVKY